METDKRLRPESLPDDIMLSSAEDLNIDGSFMGGDKNLGEEDRHTPDDDLDAAVEELLNSEEPEDAQIDPVDEDERVEERHEEAKPARIFVEERREETPVVVMPVEEPEKEAPREKPVTKKPEVIRREPMPGKHGINKAALIWMVILTIILGGVVGIMLYAFILDRMEAAQGPEPNPDSSQQENLEAVAGALEIYLTTVNLDNYNTDLVLVNGGGTVTLTGTLKHTVYVNATSAETLVLSGVTIESEDNAAIVNLSKNELAIRVDGMNTLLAQGGKYASALYSNGKLTIRGDGHLMVYSSGAGSTGIAAVNGYLMNSGSVVVLGQGPVPRPSDDSLQAYFAKELPQTYKAGTIVRAQDEVEDEVVKFSAPGDFGSLFVSNDKLEDGVQYSISLGSGGAN